MFFFSNKKKHVQNEISVCQIVYATKVNLASFISVPEYVFVEIISKKERLGFKRK